VQPLESPPGYNHDKPERMVDPRISPSFFRRAWGLEIVLGVWITIVGGVFIGISPTVEYRTQMAVMGGGLVIFGAVIMGVGIHKFRQPASSGEYEEPTESDPLSSVTSTDSRQNSQRRGRYDSQGMTIPEHRLSIGPIPPIPQRHTQGERNNLNAALIAHHRTIVPGQKNNLSKDVNIKRKLAPRSNSDHQSNIDSAAVRAHGSPRRQSSISTSSSSTGSAAIAEAQTLAAYLADKNNLTKALMEKTMASATATASNDFAVSEGTETILEPGADSDNSADSARSSIYGAIGPRIPSPAPRIPSPDPRAPSPATRVPSPSLRPTSPTPPHTDSNQTLDNKTTYNSDLDTQTGNRKQVSAAMVEYYHNLLTRGDDSTILKSKPALKQPAVPKGILRNDLNKP